MSVRKLVVGIYSFSSCEGCRHEILNLGEELLEFLERNGIEIAYEPLLGFSQERKYYDVVFVEGAVTTKESLEKLYDLRKRARILVALGSCSVLGGIASMARMYRIEELLSIYGSKNALESELLSAKPISEYVEVDFWLRGCPINAQEFLALLSRIARGEWFKQAERRFEFCRTAIYTIEGRVLKLEGSKCIVCGRCVGICRELRVNAIGIVNRGIDVAVTTPFLEPFEKTSCIFCGLCTAVCPVDAFRVRDDIHVVQRALNSGRSLDLYIEPEVLAALAAKYRLDDVRKLFTALRKLGFQRVFVWSPLSRARIGPGLTIVPASEAEHIFVERFYPELRKYLTDPPKLPYEGVVVTACTARKLQGEPVLIAREVDLMLKKLDVEILPPSEPDGVYLPTMRGFVKSVGPYEVRGVLEAILKGYIREGTVVLYICPYGCLGGGGQPYVSEDPEAEAKARGPYLEELQKLGYA